MGVVVTTLTMLSLGNHALAQLTPVQSNALTALLTEAALQPQNHLNAQSVPVLVFLDNGKVPAMANFSWFGNPVQLATLPTIQTANTNAWLEVEQLFLGAVDAYVRFYLVTNNGQNRVLYEISMTNRGNGYVKIN